MNPTDPDLALSILHKIIRGEDIIGTHLGLDGIGLVIDGTSAELTPDEWRLVDRIATEEHT